MFVFKSESVGDGTVYDEKHFKDLGKKLAEDSIANFKKDLDKIFNGDE